MNPADRDRRIESQIVAPLRDGRAELDQLHRARLGAAIEGALDREDQARRASPGGLARPRRFVVWGIAVAAGVAAIVAWRSAHTPIPVLPSPTVVASAPAPALLKSYGRGAEGALPPSTSLVAPAGEKARATIGTRVRLTLVGPGRVSVLAAARAGDLELALDGGRLLVDYDGRAGGTLRVRSPGAVTTVVGTLFAVDATPFGSRVAVAHGRVRTEDASGREWQIAAGTNWSSAEQRVSPLGNDLAAAMREHEASWAGSVPAPPPPEPVHHTSHAPPAQARATAVDLDALYARAEAAMRRRDLGSARKLLETIAVRDRAGALGDAALLDLARLALADGDPAEARRVLARLSVPLHDAALKETAEHLRCRAGAADAGPCP